MTTRDDIVADLEREFDKRCQAMRHPPNTCPNCLRVPDIGWVHTTIIRRSNSRQGFCAQDRPER